MKCVYLSIVFFMCILLAACSPKRIEKDFNRLEKETRELLDARITLDHKNRTDVDERYHIRTLLEQGITCHDAVRIALLHNTKLPVLFKNIGISKADLVQAQLFTNPYLETVFDFPVARDYFQTSRVVLQLNFKLSDLWKVPLKKNVAKDDLEIALRELFKEIVTTAAEAKKAYYECLYAVALRGIILDMGTKVQSLRDEVYNAGRQTDLDINLADILIGFWEIERIEVEQRIETAFLNLRNTIGLAIIQNQIELKGDPFFELNIPPYDDIAKMLPQYQPDLRIIEMKMQQAQHQIKLERGRVFNDVTLGFTHIRDLENQVARGVIFDLSIPAFDMNQAQIAKAKHISEKYTKLYHDSMRHIQTDLNIFYVLINAAQKAVSMYDELLPLHRETIKYATSNVQAADFNMLLVVNMYKKYYEAQKAMLMAYQEQANALVDIEKLLGKELHRAEQHASS